MTRGWSCLNDLSFGKLNKELNGELNGKLNRELNRELNGELNGELRTSCWTYVMLMICIVHEQSELTSMSKAN